MRSKKQNISKHRIKLSISVPPDQMTELFNNEYDKLKETVEIPGFRRGKAPRIMTIEKIGRNRLSQLALQKGIDQSFRKSLVEHQLYPVTSPSITISKHPSFLDKDSENELVYDVEFDILPKAKIGDYKKIKVDKIDSKLTEVTDEEVNKVLDYLRRQAAELKQIDRGVERGDWVELSFEGSINNVVKEKLSSHNLPLVVGETKLIPGFEDKIVGMKKDENKEFELELPSDFYDKEFAGKKIKFKVTVINVKEMKLPKVDNNFVERFGAKSERELKDNIRKGLFEEKKDREKQKQIAQIAQQIINITKVDVPQSLIENEKSRMKEVLVKDLSSRGITMDKYLESLKIGDKKLDSDLEKQAKRNIVLGVGIGEIAKAEKINLSVDKGTNPVFEFLIDKNVK